MNRPRLVTLMVVVSFVIGAEGIDTSRAKAAITTLPVVLLAQNDAFVAAGDGCSFDIGDDSDATLRIVNSDGQPTGGFTLNEGEIINAVGPSEVRQNYCAFAESVDPGATGVVRLEINDNFLMSLNVDTFNPYKHLVLEVNSGRLVAIAYASDSEVRSLGLEPLDVSLTEEPGPTESATAVARTSTTASVDSTPTETSTTVTLPPRAELTPPTSEPVALPPDASDALRNTRDKLQETSPQTGIVTGIWDLEEPPMLNILFVAIYEDPDRYGPNALAAFTLEEIEVLFGFPILSEDPAVQGCRAFTLQGPYQITMYTALCADGEYLLTVVGTDQTLVRGAMQDFMDGKPFTIPPGYQEIPQAWNPAYMERAA